MNGRPDAILDRLRVQGAPIKAQQVPETPKDSFPGVPKRPSRSNRPGDAPNPLYTRGDYTQDRSSPTYALKDSQYP